MRRRASIVWIVIIAASCAAPSTQTLTPLGRRFDLILRRGRVIDGSGAAAFNADVGITGGHVAAIGDLSRSTAATELDVRGLHVAPGFVNIHSHANVEALGSAENMLRQGVTSEIINPDGGGNPDVARLLARTESTALAVNVGAYAPFNSVWQQVVGNVDRRPSDAEFGQMRSLLEAALGAGAWGVSAGLDYKPAYFATTDEVVTVLAPLKRWRTNFPNHDRLKPEWGYSSLAAMRETIEIGERSGLVPVITHMKLQGVEQGKVDSALAMMARATRRGVYTAADVYPYLAGQTALSALFIPGWAQEGGRAAMLQRFADAAMRTRVARETEDAIKARVGSAANIYLPARRMTVQQLMPELKATTEGEAVIRVLEQGEQTMIATFGAESDLVKIMQYADAAIACDCGASRGGAHPRGYGTFPRVLGHYVRETRALTLTDAVRKMTGLPATMIGLVDRGFVAVGMAADLVIFDSAAVIDHATYEKPTEWSTGVHTVVVNGRIALRDGTPMGATSGQTLRRTSSMPSRPATRDSIRRISVNEGDVSVNVAQSPGERAAVGNIRISHGGMQIEARELGIVQTALGWASVTGVGRLAGGAMQPFTLIVDRADPFADGRGTLTLRVPRMPEVRVPLSGR